jgi:saccharopine dehydrogenase-like NADP-dependent oxidoreductase
MGLQGKAAAHDLENSSAVQQVLVCDVNTDSLQRYLQEKNYRKIQVKPLDADNERDLAATIAQSGADVVVSMLPVRFGFKAAQAALKAGVHFVSSSYTGKVARLDAAARKKGITILPEMGMDPGIDLMLARLAVDEIEDVYGLYSYGAGIPEPACANDNCLRYKISWTFEGVLQAYRRDAVVLRDGTVRRIAGDRIFREENVHRVDFAGLGRLEAYPNGDALTFIPMFGLGKNLRHMGRFALRWPGHCRFWSTLAALGLLDDNPCDPAASPFSPRRFLATLLSPQLLYGEGEQDIVVIRVQAWGKSNGQGKLVIREVTDRRDLATGLFAMNRTVGYTASIGAQMILSGKITKRGVLSPARDVPAADFLREIEKRGINTIHRTEKVDPDLYAPDRLAGTDPEE